MNSHLVVVYDNMFTVLPTLQNILQSIAGMTKPPYYEDSPSVARLS